MLEEAISKVTGETRRVVPASRTDAGVHARFQVVSFRSGTTLDSDTLMMALNYHLPDDIAVKAAAMVDPGFCVRRDAIGREYEYLICNSRARSPLKEGLAYQVPRYLDTDIMNNACSVLIGEHDFISFSSASGDKKDTVHNISKAEFERHGEDIIFTIRADSFLMHQVRNTLGVLIAIGTGKKTIDDLKQILEKRRKGLARPAVPSYGLYLIRVYYPEDVEIKYENLFNKIS
jgi:tRNA pseudouridine38-40 synthase